jgi:WD40 repeat protein
MSACSHSCTQRLASSQCRQQLAILKKPPVDMHKTVTLVQLASQEPAGSRFLPQAHAASHSLQYEVIEWFDKRRTPLPCIMEILEHSDAVLAVVVSPDGKWIASASKDKTVKVVEMSTGRLKCTLTGHRSPRLP